MKYKTYKLTNFACPQTSLPHIQKTFKDVVDFVDSDKETSDLAKRQMIADLFHVRANRYLSQSPVNKKHKFEIHRVKQND